jgi:hypothetical protein
VTRGFARWTPVIVQERHDTFSMFSNVTPLAVPPPEVDRNWGASRPACTVAPRRVTAIKIAPSAVPQRRQGSAPRIMSALPH